MSQKIKLGFTLVLLLLVACAGPPQLPQPAREAVYIEPALFSPETDVMSVIVTAGGSAAATRAVEHVGGRVTSALWLIDAVAAAIPTAQLDALAAYPGVRSIVNNKPVRAAVEPDPDTLVMDQTWPVPVDVGADVLHTSGITGTGVGVAVVDSGMFFSPGLVNSQGQQVAIQYIGQADFVDKKNCQLGKTNCMNNGENSRDPYGHGSHVTRPAPIF